MKRFNIALMTVLMMAGCQDNQGHGDTCGDGVLGENEVCDGTLIRQGAAYCPDGSLANVAMVKCTQACGLDTSAACTSHVGAVCGNHIVEPGEQCDGSVPAVTALCENPDLSKLKCVGCKLVDEGVCKAKDDDKKPAGLCGNGRIDAGEYCDGVDIPEAARKCPENMALNVNPLFTCMDSCKLVDVSKACHLSDAAHCGNGQLDEGELCDGELINDAVYPSISCKPGTELDKSQVKCKDCEIDASKACVASEYQGLIISELVPYIEGNSFVGLAVEIANTGASAYDVSQCKLSLYSESKIEKQYALKDLGVTGIEGHKVSVICSQTKEGDFFGGTCNVTLTKDEILSNLANKVLLGLTCGDDKIVDLVRLGSLVAGIEHGAAVDFIRQCGVWPHTTTDTVSMGDGWSITADNHGAPSYNLGEHCPGLDISGDDISCKYSISRHELNDRRQSIDMSLEIRIPGITDKTEKTDITKSMSLEFITSKVKENGSVSYVEMHYVTPAADETWTDANGIDRYTGTLRNWDTYEGYWESDQGKYVMDARISFDHGASYIYCGPNGLIKNYDTYVASQRETLTVSYADTAVCGDGVISDSEVCDGASFIPEVLVCPEEGEAILNPYLLSCTCSSISEHSYAKACGKPISTCGDGKRDTGEVCDGSDIPDEAKACEKGEVLRGDAKWECGSTCAYVDRSNACETACGNGKIDAEVVDGKAEACDGDQIPETLKKCPGGMIAKENPVWTCDSKCSAVVTEQACEAACGNGRVDAEAKETCDGSAYIEDVASVCKDSWTYDESRKSCTDKCRVDGAACIPEIPIVIDEYVIKTSDANPKLPKAMAVSINLYGNKALQDYSRPNAAGEVEPVVCTLSVLDSKGLSLSSSYSSTDASGSPVTIQSTSMYPFEVIRPASYVDKKFQLEPCKPLVICSIPMDTEADYKLYHDEVFGGRCDATVSLPTSASALQGNYFITKRGTIARMQLSCDGNYIDFLDFSGLNKAFSQSGKTHGKLKAADRRPWASSTTTDINKRMDLDDTFDMTKFAKPVCE